MSNLKAHKFLLTTSFLLVIFGVLAFSNYLINGESKTKSSLESGTVLEENSTNSDSISNPTEENAPDNSVKMEVNNKVNTTEENNSTSGTCKVTRNGVTTIVPAEEVKVYEKSTDDINVKVDCDNRSSSTNGSSSNKTSIKNDIKVNVQSSP